MFNILFFDYSVVASKTSPGGAFDNEVLVRKSQQSFRDDDDDGDNESILAEAPFNVKLESLQSINNPIPLAGAQVRDKESAHTLPYARIKKLVGGRFITVPTLSYHEMAPL